MTMGIQAYNYRMYEREKAIQEAKKQYREQLEQKPLEVVQRYKNLTERRWNNRPFLYKIWTYGLEPIRLTVAKELLENKLKE